MSTPPPPDRPSSFADVGTTLSLRAMGNTTLHHRRFRRFLLGDRTPVDVLRPVNLDIGVGAFLALPDGDVAVSAGDLAAWGVTLDDVIRQALADGPGEPAMRRVGPVHCLHGDRFVASVLLRPELLDGLSLRGAPVILVPTVEDLLVVGSDDAGAATALADVGRSIVAGSPATPVSTLPLTRDDHDWSLYEPPGDAEQSFCDLAREWSVARYADQQPLLRAHYERVGADCYVAGLRLIERDGRPVAVAVVTDGVPTVIPMADEVRLVRLDDRSGEVVGVVAFEDLQTTPGMLTKVPRTVPPMYRVHRFPEGVVRSTPVGTA